MAWEARDGHRYYYRKVRRGGKVVSEYVGGGVLGALAAALDEKRRVERWCTLELERERRAEFGDADRRLSDSAERLRLLVSDFLDGTGYHRHRGQWRKRRHGGQDAPSQDQDEGRRGVSQGGR